MLIREMPSLQPSTESKSGANDGDGNGDGSQQTTTAPLTMNKQLIRGAILIGILAFSVSQTKNTTSMGGQDASNDNRGRHIWILIHLLSFSSWFGCSMWVSFIAGIIMFKNLPRHVFGRLQSKLFPAYFLFSAVCIALSIVSAAYLQWDNKSLTVIEMTVLLNLVYFEPKTTAVMYERHIVERKLGTGHEVGQLKPSDPTKANDTELKRLSKQFGMLHGISTLMNLGALGVGCYWLNFCAQQMS
mmetsp:Transcript_20191/g.48179  ORF Transcript_20191/g.48179 Transcript_20191/m.48179 type:complete len:244 (-) Transcript_20191:63-794(-)